MTARPAMGKLTVGQPVMIRQSTNEMRRRPDSERYIPAVVVKAGRVWVTVAATQKVIEWRMRMDKQHEGSGYTGSNASFATLEQHEWDKAQNRAHGVLKDHGIQLDPGSLWTGREAELADLLSEKAPTTEPAPFTVHHLDGTFTVHHLGGTKTTTTKDATA